MSYIKLEHRVLNDPRILDLSAAGLTAHLYALDFCNEQATDGTIPIKVAHRMMCQLDPTEIVEAFKELVVVGLWESGGDTYTCPEFLAYGLEGDEQRSTRDKWAQDKRRQRLHGIGNHALCLPARCPAKAAQGTGSTDGVDSAPQKVWTTRPDPTRPDQTPKGSGSGSGIVLPHARSAGAPRGEAHVVRGKGSSPWDFSLEVAAGVERHGAFVVFTGMGRDSAIEDNEIPAGEVNAAFERFGLIAENIVTSLAADFAVLRTRHKCDECRMDYQRDDHLPSLHFIVPEPTLDHWTDRIEHHINQAIELGRVAS